MAVVPLTDDGQDVFVDDVISPARSGHPQFKPKRTNDKRQTVTFSFAVSLSPLSNHGLDNAFSDSYAIYLSYSQA
jgi:hypothetical protein